MADRIPLLQKLAQGQIVFDIPTGRLISARVNIDKTLENHQGPGSNYRFQSYYSEDLITPSPLPLPLSLSPPLPPGPGPNFGPWQLTKDTDDA